jgi:hypothetical protein
MSLIFQGFDSEKQQNAATALTIPLNFPGFSIREAARSRDGFSAVPTTSPRADEPSPAIAREGSATRPVSPVFGG